MRVWAGILWRRLGVGRSPEHHRNGQLGEWFSGAHLCCPSVESAWSALQDNLNGLYSPWSGSRLGMAPKYRHRFSVWRSCGAAVVRNLAVSGGPVSSSHCQDGSGLRSSPGSNASSTADVARPHSACRPQPNSRPSRPRRPVGPRNGHRHPSVQQTPAFEFTHRRPERCGPPDADDEVVWSAPGCDELCRSVWSLMLQFTVL
jgi:hypothetical protein